MRPAPGFTRIELLVALAVAAVLATLSARSAADAFAAGKSAGYRTALAESLIAALNESTIGSHNVVVCPSATGTTCAPGVDWTVGWIAWVDLDGNRSRDAGEALVRAQPRLDGGVRVRSSAGRTLLSFQPHGGATAGSNVTFTFCTRRAATAGTLVLANSGRLRTGEPTSAQLADCLAMP